MHLMFAYVSFEKGDLFLHMPFSFFKIQLMVYSWTHVIACQEITRQNRTAESRTPCGGLLNRNMPLVHKFYVTLSLSPQVTGLLSDTLLSVSRTVSVALSQSREILETVRVFLLLGDGETTLVVPSENAITDSPSCAGNKPRLVVKWNVFPSVPHVWVYVSSAAYLALHLLVSWLHNC